MQPACILGEVTVLEPCPTYPFWLEPNDASDLLSACRDLGLAVINVPQDGAVSRESRQTDGSYRAVESEHAAGLWALVHVSTEHFLEFER